MGALKNIHSHLTAKERKSLSFPSKILRERNLLKGKILDFGCGLGKDVEFLKSEGFDIVGYDPYYFPELPLEKFDTIICHYVLNVLEKQDQFKVLIDISRLLNPKGHGYFSVRRDVKKSGYRMHKIHQLPTYQTNVTLPYKSIFLNENCEIYDYQRIVDLDISQECIFCNPSGMNLIAESAICYAIYDKFPVSKGHALIIPKRHTSNFFELKDFEKMSLWMFAEEVKEILMHEYEVSDFNVGFNIGEHAGQSVMHTHLHVIPRYQGDVENPIGGIRNVIPGKGDYKSNVN